MDIKIDTELMQQMANISLRAKIAMDEATKAANSITLHDDWNCVERDYINESVLNIKNSNNRINESMMDFSNKLNELAEKFNEFDRSLLAQFSGFDSSVGEILAIKPLETLVNPVKFIGDGDSGKGLISFNDYLKQMSSGDYLGHYTLSTWDKQISIVNFSDAGQVVEGK